MKYAVVRDPTRALSTHSRSTPNTRASRPIASANSAPSSTRAPTSRRSSPVAASCCLPTACRTCLSAPVPPRWYSGTIAGSIRAGAGRQVCQVLRDPGLGHAFGAAFTPGWDSLTALENWVEKGIAPANQIVTDTAGMPGRTRPLCEYPTWPKYKGAGDVNLASSFTCSHEGGREQTPSSLVEALVCSARIRFFRLTAVTPSCITLHLLRLVVSFR